MIFRVPERVRIREESEREQPAKCFQYNRVGRLWEGAEIADIYKFLKKKRW